MFEKIKKVMSAEEAAAAIPMTEDLIKIKAARDAELKAIIDGTDSRKS